MKTRDILEALKSGKIDTEEALSQIQGYADLGHSRVDLLREKRNGAPEVVFGQGKETSQIIDIAERMRQDDQACLITRLDSNVGATLGTHFPEATYHATARLLSLGESKLETASSSIAVVCAGTSDLPVAEEVRLTCEFYKNPVVTVYDAGVAGLHRLLASLESIRSCKVIIVVAGMEGALPSVVGGLVDAPVIAVPTSVGYGASFGGVAALLGMLNSCASGLSVVNIDNGFGAGYLANRINRL